MVSYGSTFARMVPQSGDSILIYSGNPPNHAAVAAATAATNSASSNRIIRDAVQGDGNLEKSNDVAGNANNYKVVSGYQGQRALPAQSNGIVSNEPPLYMESVPPENGITLEELLEDDPLKDYCLEPKKKFNSSNSSNQVQTSVSSLGTTDPENSYVDFPSELGIGNTNSSSGILTEVGMVTPTRNKITEPPAYASTTEPPLLSPAVTPKTHSSIRFEQLAKASPTVSLSIPMLPDGRFDTISQPIISPPVSDLNSAKNILRHVSSVEKLRHTKNLKKNSRVAKVRLVNPPRLGNFPAPSGTGINRGTVQMATAAAAASMRKRGIVGTSGYPKMGYISRPVSPTRRSPTRRIRKTVSMTFTNENSGSPTINTGNITPRVNNSHTTPRKRTVRKTQSIPEFASLTGKFPRRNKDSFQPKTYHDIKQGLMEFQVVVKKNSK